MNYKQMPIYLCSFTKEWNENIKSEGIVAGHEFCSLNGKNIIWPKNIDAETVNPKNLIELKKHFDLEEFLIVDRLAGINDVVSIINHINRSGQNFLRGKTPERKFPQFPDMSKIYNKIDGFNKSIVHTVGIKRFQNLTDEEKTIWSESVGLVAPVAHYVGIRVFAIGGSNFDEINKIIIRNMS